MWGGGLRKRRGDQLFVEIGIGRTTIGGVWFQCLEGGHDALQHELRDAIALLDCGTRGDGIQGLGCNSVRIQAGCL